MSDPELGQGAFAVGLPDAGGPGGAEGVELQAEPGGPETERDPAEPGGERLVVPVVATTQTTLGSVVVCVGLDSDLLPSCRTQQPRVKC